MANQWVFIPRDQFEANPTIEGSTIPEVQLLFQTPDWTAAKLFLLSVSPKKTFFLSPALLVLKGNKIHWIGENQDPAFQKLLEQNAEFASKPETFIVKTVDDYSESLFDRLNEVEENFNQLEDEVLKQRTKHSMEKIFTVKKHLVKIRQSNRHLLRLVGQISRESKTRYNETITLYEKLLHLDEATDTYKELLSNMVDAHLSIISNKMSQVMKILTVIATTALPLTVISGIYGMNIHLPLQEQNNAFQFIIGAMILVVVLMLGLFLKMGWLREK